MRKIANAKDSARVLSVIKNPLDLNMLSIAKCGPVLKYRGLTTLVTGGLKRRTRQNTCYKSLTINDLVTIVSGNPCPLVTSWIEKKGTWARVTFKCLIKRGLARFLHY